ncbi:MAG: enoyl-CoA hydratase [Pseudomonadota bacterium]|jgi:2-(1,2-epoxy-1,2-dihydrophenyl)acetyl-CoA isomerase
MTNTPSDFLLETLEDGIATLTLNRPEVLNATLPETFERMAHSLERMARDPAVRLVVITGAGTAFSSGADLKALAKATGGERPAAGAADPAKALRARMETERLLHEMPKPTLAVIPGIAMGAGFSLALACDLRIGSDDARLCTGFVKVGLSGDHGGAYFLTQLVGSAIARELYFSGRMVAADEALRLGLFNRVVPADQLRDAANAWARELAAQPTVALGLMKQNLNTAMRGLLPLAFDTEVNNILRCVATDDHKEAIAAAMQKRPPRFTGQ